MESQPYNKDFLCTLIDALQVSFSAVPSGPVFKAASFIRLNCSATGGVPPLQYCFIQSCRQTGNKTFNGINSERFSFIITTNPLQCSNQFMCQVTGSTKNTRTAEFTINELTGRHAGAHEFRLSTEFRSLRELYM